MHTVVLLNVVVAVLLDEFTTAMAREKEEEAERLRLEESKDRMGGDLVRRRAGEARQTGKYRVVNRWEKRRVYSIAILFLPLKLLFLRIH